MKLGLLTAPFPDTALGEVADWARSAGFEALEIACWPKTSGASRRYAGTSHIDVDISAAEAEDIAAGLAGKGLAISGLGFYPNPLHPDRAHREAVIDHLKKVIVLASRMGVSLVNTFCGGDASKTVDANWEDAQKVWPAIIAHARAHGVKLAFENCPMIFSYDEWPGGHNIAYSPYVWRRILEAWGGDVGMNFDPSHLVWQMIDKERFIREFGKNMLHVHAKDLMIDHDGLYERGILSAGIGWQVPRMPGLGDIDWSRIFSGLYRAGYDGPVIIEHEDRRFEGTDEKVKRGFLLARDVLRPFIK
ncbi:MULTISPECIES: sugar phosphate isomerase/epimerase [unclassified Mesorhizobium]|uniref:sugar phosphate isomerase/epimerase family protein n=1 Tax=unclassified Mesorhizobium TaxID=325217 RepID=UPI000F750AE4|nr:MULTISPECIES: sugar phosphate isomerase/epimerase [unclassified Mesorhizobium]AZO18751.1 sugar phosphate isomerase/epimerase [Mesorhizobium sp. M2A.F.Ca.ET.043.05.1.1]RWD70055.1 MAG: sugar phosphate isomerase/epimerase [Mesorhizobium sp.]RWE77780.1 MAG: sugar phosphate isomerase/epimerase [Mesorhizobium sp.]TIV25462.1 MAG: sugar phosphate isomerase/epimerase [Mesorhizobium sp.]TIV58440.1 MAG: sugar phosphate isomerase/epimerase [Mesorhizobium sp.]